MKNLFFKWAFLGLIFPFALMGQNDGEHRGCSEDKMANRIAKMKSMKVAFITNELTLTEEEAQEFWPIHNKYENKRQELRREKRAFMEEYQDKDLSESDAESVLNYKMKYKEDKLALEKSRHEELLKIMSLKKIAQYYELEREFKKRVMRKSHHHKKRGNKD